MTQTVQRPPFVLTAGALPDVVAEAVLDRALAASPEVGVLDVSGPGAIASLQGLLTIDIEKPGPGGYMYGAVLTPKGMILCDAWIARNATAATLILPRRGADVLLEVVRRTLPPRLARFTDRSADVGVIRVVGPQALDVLRRADLSAPEPGHAQAAIVRDMHVTVARPMPGAPFAVELHLPMDQRDTLLARLAEAGALTAPAGLELARVLAGWPGLGIEIDDRTLPQEVRFDEVGGVSYTKGCYTGQETVARVHFRGHPNRHLRGLIWDAVPDAAVPDVFQDGKPRGRVGTALWLEPVERWIGLGLLRREVDGERPVIAAGAEAAVVELPFRIDT